MSTPQPQINKFLYGAYHFATEEWYDNTRVRINAICHTELAEIWQHNGMIETHMHNSNAPNFYIEAIRNWLKSDIRQHMTLEQFLEQVFP